MALLSYKAQVRSELGVVLWLEWFSQVQGQSEILSFPNGGVDSIWCCLYHEAAPKETWTWKLSSGLNIILSQDLKPILLETVKFMQSLLHHIVSFKISIPIGWYQTKQLFGKMIIFFLFREALNILKNNETIGFTEIVHVPF